MIKRAAAYVRVSSEEQVSGYSLGAQERAAQAFCASQGWEMTSYREEGKSARTDDISRRPALKRLLANVEKGHIHVVIVHKLDRFARNRRVAFDAFERLGKSGVGFVSVAEHLDYSSPAGQLMLTMLVGLAQFYSDNLSFETKKGKGERKARGLPNGLLPFGTATDSSGLPVLDTQAKWCDVATRREVVPADGLQLAFELAAAGKTDREVAQALSAAGYRTSGNRGRNPLSKDTVRMILQNRFYLGELPDGQGGWLPGKHGTLIDPDLFDRAHRARQANASRPRRVAGQRLPWALSGVAICGSCGASVTVMTNGSGKRRVRCAGRAQGNGCDEPGCYASTIEDQIAEVLQAFTVPPQEQDRLLTAWKHFADRSVDATAQRVVLERKLARLKELYVESDLAKAEYQAKRNEVLEQLRALPEEARDLDVVGRRLATYLADLAKAWTDATSEERNRIARQLFTTVVVKNRTAVALVPRPDLRPFFVTVAVNPDGKECTGGSDGGRTRACVTRHVPPSSSPPLRLVA